MSKKAAPTTLEECLEAGGERVPKSRRVGLKGAVTHFLEVKLVPAEGIEKKSQHKQDVHDSEMRGFYRAQEKLRETIAMGGTDAIAELADIRVEGQQRPRMMAGMRTWLG